MLRQSTATEKFKDHCSKCGSEELKDTNFANEPHVSYWQRQVENDLVGSHRCTAKMENTVTTSGMESMGRTDSEPTRQFLQNSEARRFLDHTSNYPTIVNFKRQDYLQTIVLIMDGQNNQIGGITDCQRT